MFEYRNIHSGRLVKFGLLMLVTAFLGGCPVFDPYTESLLENNTDTTATVIVVLDMQRHGVDKKETAIELAPEWLQRFTLGDDVTMVRSNHQELTGTFEVVGGGIMVMHESLGRYPYFTFEKLTVVHQGRTRVFTDRDVFESLFQKSGNRGEYSYVLPISTLWSAQ